MQYRTHTSPPSPSSSTSISSHTSAHTCAAHVAKGHKEGTGIGAEYKIGSGATRYKYPQLKGPLDLSLKEYLRVLGWARPPILRAARTASGAPPLMAPLYGSIWATPPPPPPHLMSPSS